MANLLRAHQELYQRTPDECFDSLEAVQQHCLAQQQESVTLWEQSRDLKVTPLVHLEKIGGETFRLNDWSFSQVCRMAGVRKETINRLSSDTASRVLGETMPTLEKPLQLLATDEEIRSIHGAAYTRLWNTELLDILAEFGSDFRPPQKAMDGQSSGLYCGEQDLFAFLIDPTGWTEIDGEAFAPGFFAWNSEVGRRSLGIQTFWFQKVCQNHIVWDATEVAEFSCKHTTNVRQGLDEIRAYIERLVSRRDERRDSFATVLRKAMVERLGSDADDVSKTLLQRKFPRKLIDEAMRLAEPRGFTIFGLVDAMTKLTQHASYAAERTRLDQQASRLLSLAL